MENKIVLDSCVWIAYLNKGDSQNKKAEKVLDGIKGKIVLPEYIILEVCSVLSMRVSKETANKFLKLALNNKDIYLLISSENLFYDTTQKFIKNTKKNLSFTDISLICLNKSFKVITFDKELKKELERKSKS